LLLPGTGRGTVRRTVEGAQPPALAHDSANDTLQIAKYLACRNAKHRKAKPLQIVISPAIPLLRRWAIMSIAVDFDPKPYL
jgi:hypothetical protein